MSKKIAVRCVKINPIHVHHRKLTVGEWYEASTFKSIGHLSDTYSIYKDGESIGMFYKELFITLAEWREDQIDSILEE